MDPSRIDIHPVIWKQLFGREPTTEEKARLLENALIGVNEWADFLGVTVRRMRQVIAEHMIIQTVREVRSDEIDTRPFFVAGHIFSPVECKIVTYEDDDFIVDDGRKTTQIPICFDKEQLRESWLKYQKIAKSQKRSAAAKGIKTVTPRPSDSGFRDVIVFDKNGDPFWAKVNI
jgi:hypothetical protein